MLLEFEGGQPEGAAALEGACRSGSRDGNQAQTSLHYNNVGNQGNIAYYSNILFLHVVSILFCYCRILQLQ